MSYVRGELRDTDQGVSSVIGRHGQGQSPRRNGLRAKGMDADRLVGRAAVVKQNGVKSSRDRQGAPRKAGRGRPIRRRATSRRRRTVSNRDAASRITGTGRISHFARCRIRSGRRVDSGRSKIQRGLKRIAGASRKIVSTCQNLAFERRTHCLSVSQFILLFLLKAADFRGHRHAFLERNVGGAMNQFVTVPIFNPISVFVFVVDCAFDLAK